MGFSYVKVFDYSSIGFFIQQADNINSQSWNDETGNDFVNTGVSKKFFPDKHCTATEENACNSAFDSSAAPEKAEQYKRAKRGAEACPGICYQLQDIVVGVGSCLLYTSDAADE